MRANDEKVLKQAETPEPRPQPVGEAVGALAGAATGASAGVIGGPIGILIGAAAGALGGWWAGHAVHDSLKHFNDDEYRRRHTQWSPNTGYEEARDFYRFGHLAGSNPDYEGRRFEEVEPQLRETIQKHDEAVRIGRWDDVRGYVAEGYKARRKID